MRRTRSKMSARPFFSSSSETDLLRGNGRGLFYIHCVIHATETALLAPPSEEGCLEAPGRNSAKSAVVVGGGDGGFQIVERSEQKKTREVKGRNSERNLLSQLTRVKHDVQVQRARRAARDVLAHGELLLNFVC